MSIRTPRSDDYSEYAETVRREARDRAGERGRLVRHEVSDRMFDVMTEYFPEEYAARRRGELGRAFGAGLLGRELVRYARR